MRGQGNKGGEIGIIRVSLREVSEIMTGSGTADLSSVSDGKNGNNGRVIMACTEAFLMSHYNLVSGDGLFPYIHQITGTEFTSLNVHFTVACPSQAATSRLYKYDFDIPGYGL